MEGQVAVRIKVTMRMMGKPSSSFFFLVRAGVKDGGKGRERRKLGCFALKPSFVVIVRAGVRTLRYLQYIYCIGN